MKVEVGAPIILVENVEALWHIPARPDDHDEERTLCGLTGTLWSYASSWRARRLLLRLQARAPIPPVPQPVWRERGRMTDQLFHPNFADPVDPSTQVARMPGTIDAPCLCREERCRFPFCVPTDQEEEDADAA